MFFFSSSKKIYSREFHKMLKNIPELSPGEISYIEQVFQKSLKDGLSMFELKKEIERLKHKPNDPLEPSEVEKVKKRIMEKLGS